MRRPDLLIALIVSIAATTSTLFLYNEIQSYPSPGIVLAQGISKETINAAIIRSGYCIGRINFGTQELERGMRYGDSNARVFFSEDNQTFSIGSYITFQLNPLGQVVEGAIRLSREQQSVTVTLTDVNPIHLTLSYSNIDWPNYFPTEFSIPGPLTLRDRGEFYDLEYARFSQRTTDQIINQVRKNPAVEQLMSQIIADTKLVPENTECASYPSRPLELSKELSNPKTMELLVSLANKQSGAATK